MAQQPDPGCENYQAWQIQSNPRTDPTGKNNHAYPEYNATYWATKLSLPLGTVVTIKGQYPRARYMALQVYDENKNVLSAIGDVQINPDPGQNNPYRTGVAQGSYTVSLVFGRGSDINIPPNRLHTAGLVTVGLIYRIYYSNNPEDLTGGTVNPVLPNLIVNGVTWTSCPPRPILSPEEATLSGRLDDIDFVGSPPPNKPVFPAPPIWQFWVTSPFTPYFPSQDNSYMSVIIDRTLLRLFLFDMVVIRLKTPTFPNTQAGVPPYSPANVRFWSICQDELLTNSVVRCTPDNKANTLDGYATFVISDPSRRPSDAVLNQWGANWIPWGALLPTDVIPNANGRLLTNADGVFYYGVVLYRQTQADPNFTQSIANVSVLRPWERREAMGEYWPQIGYCRSAAFHALGAGCIRN